MLMLEELKARLDDLVRKFEKSFSAKIKADTNLLESIMFYTGGLMPQVKMKTRVYRILNGIDMKPICQNCGKSMVDRDIKNMKAGYRKYCCPKCAKDSALRKETYTRTCLARYGVCNASSNDVIKAKRAKTNVSRLGVDNPAKSGKVKEKIFKTNVSRYGCGCALHSEHCRKKTLNTIIDRYGTTSYSKTQEFLEKMTAENMKNFGVSYPN